MWEQQEFDKHWKTEFPDGEVPKMDLNSVEDIEMELEKCKANLKTLQRAVSEEKFKVFYLQTIVARREKSYDKERRGSRDENLNTDSAFSKTEPDTKLLRASGKVDKESMSGCMKLQAPGNKGSADHGSVIQSIARDMTRISSRTGKPVPVPPRKPSFQKGNTTLPGFSQADGNCIGRIGKLNSVSGSKEGSDHEYEDEEMNENFVQSNLVTPKTTTRDSQRMNPQRDALRPFRQSKDFDSSDDGRLSPSCMQVPFRASRGSGCSTPDRRSDGYLSSDHEDSSSAGRKTCFLHYSHS